MSRWVANYCFSPEKRRLDRLALELIYINSGGRRSVADYSSFPWQDD